MPKASGWLKYQQRGGSLTNNNTMTDSQIIENYSDVALQGEMDYLRKTDHLGKWGHDRLHALEAEARRRNIKSRP